MIHTFLCVQVPMLSEDIFITLIQVYIIYTIHVLLSLSGLLCTLSKAIMHKESSVQLSLSLSHTHTYTWNISSLQNTYYYTHYSLYVLLSPMLSQYNIYFPHSHIIHWQVKSYFGSQISSQSLNVIHICRLQPKSATKGDIFPPIYFCLWLSVPVGACCPLTFDLVSQ